MAGARRRKDAGTRAYQRCVGGPADYRAAFGRVRQVAEGAFGGEDLTAVNPSTGASLPGLSGDDATLRSARRPVGVRVDDPATTKKEPDQWRELQVLLRPIERWTDNWAKNSAGGQRQLYLAEYGSVPDPDPTCT